jgi:predicted phage tail protein
MQMEKIACNSCGAPLEVAATARFATCRHCGIQLSIQRTETATFTEAVDKLTATTEELSEKINTLTGHSELAVLDREWEMEQQQYLVTGKHGRVSIPTETGAIGGGIFITLFGGLWTVMAFSITSMAPSFGPFAIAKLVFPLFGIVFVVGGIFASITAWNKAEQYRHAERRYKNRRTELQAGDR